MVWRTSKYFGSKGCRSWVLIELLVSALCLQPNGCIQSDPYEHAAFAAEHEYKTPKYDDGYDNTDPKYPEVDDDGKGTDGKECMGGKEEKCATKEYCDNNYASRYCWN